MRLLAVVSAVFVSVMLVLGWALPSAKGSLGIRSDGSSPMQIRVDGLDAGSAYASAGGRVGDIIRLDRMPIAQRIAYDEATAGAVVDLAVDRDGRGLPDETDAIGSLAHRVGIAYEWLTRDLELKAPG